MLPVAIGGFGDIYKARLEDQDVAVKVMRGAIAGDLSQHSLIKVRRLIRLGVPV